MKHIYPAGLRLLIGVLSLLFIVGIAVPGSLRAQAYQLPATGTNVVTACSGMLYDNGGASASYSPYANGSTTIMPAIAGNKVKLQFTSISLESGYDYVYIYDGTSTNAPLIGTYNSTNQPGTVYGTSASGALTVRLTSDGSVELSGFAATIECVRTIPPQAQPDLTVQGASVSPMSVVAGGLLTASCSIYNLSGSQASSSPIGYYLSSNPVLDAADQLLSSVQGYPLPVGQYSSRYDNFTVPTGTAPGNYYVLFAADPLSQISESNETNNVTAVNLTVTPPSIDLITQQASVSPLSTAAGNPLNLGCYITNQGNSVASSSSVGFYFSRDATLDATDQLLTSQYGGQLSPPYSEQRYGTAAVPTGVVPGTYYILFVVDFQNQVGETNEANNVSAVSITVAPPGIDLVIQYEQLSPSTVVAGQQIEVSATLMNEGNTATNSSSMGFYFSTNQTFDANDVLLSNRISGMLAPYQYSYNSAYPVVPAGTAPGTYYVLFVADPQNTVVEANETNNVRSLPLTVVPPTIDLVVQSAYLNPTSVATGGTTSASCYLYNQGNAMANPATVGYYLSTNSVLDASDVLLGNSRSPLVGGSYLSPYVDLTVPASTAVGTYYVLFVADYLNQLVETNEGNNLASVMLQVVAPSIDLSFSQAYVSPYTTAPGNAINTSCYVENRGNTPSPSSTVSYYLSTNQVLDAGDVLMLTSPGGVLPASQYYSRYNAPIVPVGTVPGSYQVLFVLDPQNAVAETNETNNVTAQPLLVVAREVELSIAQPYVNPLATAPGNAISTNCSIQNSGNSVVANSTIGYYLSTNQVLDASDVLLATNVGGPLAAGQSDYRNSNPVIPASVTPGTYYVLFVADPLNAVTETNETNNVAAVALLVEAPGIDLAIQQPNHSGSSVTPGFAIAASCYIQNAGNAVAASSTVGFYLSTNQVLDASDVLLNTTAGGLLQAGISSVRTSNLMIPTGTPAGNYYLLYVADPQGVVAETNEANNVGLLPITVLGPFAGSIVPAMGGATVTTCATTIYDNGGYNNYVDYSNGSLTILPATPGTVVELVFNTFSMESGFDFVRVYDGLNANAPLLGIYTGYQMPPPLVATNINGALTVQFTSDANVNGSGFDATVTCRTAPQSDLLLTQIGASPSTVAAGSSLSLSGVIANEGAGPAASSVLGYYLSTNQTLDAGDHLLGTSSGSFMAANLSATRRMTAAVPSTMPGGTYYVLFVADPLNAVSELDESNNLAALAVTLTQVLPNREQTAGYTVGIAPNPVASGSPLRVQLSGVGATCTATLDLYNALGQRVRSQPLPLGAGRANQAEVATQNLATGVYVVRLRGPGLNVTRRVIIE
ncbi:T9SS type A sorting domain-containing protein [Hymenobacter sp. BT683]|uniref:T9SS type A sorting domain-containing protein n=1 Tax=Hymenobacter jeongseonensis TaxID=2791027 RepID=A0ABS0IKP6_9BACT|nr:CARDB domain-containing protein [Hymenobacter jeongseonensis]MBF9238737.1 T9SS type A sorting domain-containing protein [Hymenobacter jeongseonensis]